MNVATDDGRNNLSRNGRLLDTLKRRGIGTLGHLVRVHRATLALWLECLGREQVHVVALEVLVLDVLHSNVLLVELRDLSPMYKGSLALRFYGLEGASLSSRFRRLIVFLLLFRNAREIR